MKNLLLTFFLIFHIGLIFSQNSTDSIRTIRILTYNIYHGETMNHDFDLDKISRIINDANPDLVALQEVDYKTNRANKYDLTTELGIRTKMIPLFARAMYYDEGEYGEGILSKYTFVKTRNIALPYSTGNEPRTAVEVTIVLPSGDTIAFVGTHLDHLKDDNDRISQINKINKVFLTNKYPTILAGDLNAIPRSKPIDILEKYWSSSYNKNNPQPTFPSDNPTKKIDFIMHYPNENWQVIKTQIICDNIASDHCAYLVVLRLK